MRSFSGSLTELWGRSTFTRSVISGLTAPQPPVCNATVVDIVASGGNVYALYQSVQSAVGGYVAGGYYLQKRTTDGLFLWNIAVPNAGNDTGTTDDKFVPLRVDTDGSQVWVCGTVSGALAGLSGLDTLWAFDPADGSTLWSAGAIPATGTAFLNARGIPYYDVESDGSGGVFAATDGGTSDCVGTGTSGSGYVHRYSSAGSLTDQLGQGNVDRATSLLVTGGKLWVGSTYLQTYCFCPESALDNLQNWQMAGFLARYSFAGTLELLTLTGTWQQDGGGILGLVPLFNFSNEYVSRLTVDENGDVLVGMNLDRVSRDYPSQADPCDVLRVDSADGSILNAWELTHDIYDPTTSTVTGLASVPQGIAAVANSLLYYFPSGIGHANTGFLSNTTTRVDGYYKTVADDGTNFYAGGTAAGCKLDSTATAYGVTTCTASQPCECGDFNTQGEAVVGCGCDDAIGCDRYVEFQFTGCLAEFTGRIDQFKYYGPGNSDPYGHCGANECTGDHRWIGTTTGNINVGTGTPNCVTGVTMAVFVCYNCAGTGSGTNTGDWSIHLCFYNADGRQLAITPRITSEGCGPPHFTFEFDSASDIVDFIRNDGVGSTLDANDCCAFFTVSGSFGGSVTGCTSCPDGAPSVYAADMTGFAQGAGACDTCGDIGIVDLTFVTETMGDCSWVGTLTFCVETFAVTLQMASGVVSLFVFDGVSNVATYLPDATPFDCLVGGTFTRSALNYSGTECTIWPETITLSPA